MVTSAAFSPVTHPSSVLAGNGDLRCLLARPRGEHDLLDCTLRIVEDEPPPSWNFVLIPKDQGWSRDRIRSRPGLSDPRGSTGSCPGTIQGLE
uniref:Uncharacterized protein n=1 Tax=Leersia perrieri TaxID=77586 RepID=A0A0D9VFC1_9ORYZ